MVGITTVNNRSQQKCGCISLITGISGREKVTSKVKTFMQSMYCTARAGTGASIAACSRHSNSDTMYRLVYMGLLCGQIYPSTKVLAEMVGWTVRVARARFG